MYDKNTTFPVYCPDCYNSDQWGAEIFALDYDFSIPFFEQWKTLFNKIPRLSLYRHGECPNCEYANILSEVRDVYMGFSIILGSEYVYHSSNIDNSKQVIDSYNVSDSELVYESMGVNKSYNCQYSYWSSGCIDCKFMFDCNNCQDCFGCVNLRNKRFCIFNKQYSKEVYTAKIQEMNMASYTFSKNFLKEFWHFSLYFPRRHANIVNGINSFGDGLRNVKNVKNSFSVVDSENVKYGYRTVGNKDLMDASYCLRGNLIYEHVLGATDGYNLKFISNGNLFLSDSEYVDFCKSCSYLFGCLGLKNKKYCILNKQYTKEEYFEMVEKIKQHMNDMPYVDGMGKQYKYGEFFPIELCPFGYNEAVINDHFPLTKEEVFLAGYPYKEKTDNQYTITKKARDLPDDIKDIDESILNEVIECAESGKPFKITKYEFDFYKRSNIPIPRLHPDVRYKERLALKNPMKLWHRKCMKSGCQNEFETSYAPDRPEIVYCEKCYQQEVY